MILGGKVVDIRKKKGIPKYELAQKTGSISITIGSNKRYEIKPSVGEVAKIVEIIKTIPDYLVGTSNVILVQNLIKNISDILKRSSEDKNVVIKLIDAFPSYATAKKDYAP
jgi:hypothetical protein